jgi:hypothetical protein
LIRGRRPHERANNRFRSANGAERRRARAAEAAEARQDAERQRPRWPGASRQEVETRRANPPVPKNTERGRTFLSGLFRHNLVADLQDLELGPALSPNAAGLARASGRSCRRGAGCR